MIHRSAFLLRQSLYVRGGSYTMRSLRERKAALRANIPRVRLSHPAFVGTDDSSVRVYPQTIVACTRRIAYYAIPTRSRFAPILRCSLTGWISFLITDHTWQCFIGHLLLRRVHLPIPACHAAPGIHFSNLPDCDGYIHRLSHILPRFSKSGHNMIFARLPLLPVL